jgi:hypothetical protein
MFLVAPLSDVGKFSAVYVIAQTQDYRYTYSPAGFFFRAILPRAIYGFIPYPESQ